MGNASIGAPNQVTSKLLRCAQCQRVVRHHISCSSAITTGAFRPIAFRKNSPDSLDIFL